MPSISFFLANAEHPVEPDHALWERPLPQSRNPETNARLSKRTKPMTYGDYFNAVRRFCATDDWRRLLKAAASKCDRPFRLDALKQVSVFLVKHGAFYHPARLVLGIDDRRLFFVLNVAASERGRQAFSDEVRALKKLNSERPFGWFPQVYAVSRKECPMFLGDWFENFHEFHLTKNRASAHPAIVLWDGADQRRLLTPRQAADVYRNASMILTGSYDLPTGSQIFPWHHAAGDFVVRVDGTKATTRLISVRNYAPLLAGGSDRADEQELVDALTLFFLHLTVRMRLDRIDGVAEVAWAPASCLGPIVDGFFQGLDLTARISGFPASFPTLFRLYAGRQKESDLLSIAECLIGALYDDRAEEAAVIADHLADHIRGLKRWLNR